MNLPVAVNITEKDIASGKRHRCDKCPAAIATGRATAHDALIDTHSIHLLRKEQPRYEFKVPEVLREWISGFDAGRAMLPLNFQLTEELRIK